MTPSTPPAGPLDADDIAWANELAATMITTALAVASIPDNDEAEPLYEAARGHALTVETADGRGADRWLAAMFFLSAHSAALLRQLARNQGTAAEQLWQELLLRRAGRI
jgi:hypothetical protein